MKITVLGFAAIIISFCIYTTWDHDNNGQAITEINERLANKLYPFEDLYLVKQFPSKDPQIEVKERAIEKALRAIKSGQRSGGQWETQGPANIGARINTVAVSPSDNNIIFVGFAAGGIWRTIDGGVTWSPVFDDQVNTSIGKIVFHPDDPNTLLVGTGDPNIGGYYFVGNGLYKSTNLGDNWEYIGLKETRIISSITFSPDDSDIIYLGAMGAPFERNLNRGVYKSTDGGQTWELALSIDDQTGITEIIVHKDKPNIIYASAWSRIRTNKESSLNSDKAGVYRSLDSGATWEKLTNGLPEGESSRVGIAVSPTNPNLLYTIVVSSVNQNPQGLYKSENGGDSWTKMTITTPEFSSCLGGFGWYFGKLFVDPRNDKRVYVLGVDLWAIEQKDTVSMTRAAPGWGTYEVHADKHDMIYEDGFFYLATDGGLYRQDINMSSQVWEDIEDIPTTQFYRVAYNPHNPDFYVGGAQDNGTTGGNKNNITQWERIRGGDGFQPNFYKSDPNVWFSETQNGRISSSTNAGFNWQGANEGIEGSRHWDMQYIISPHDDNILYTATQQVYTSSNGLPAEWYSVSDTIVDFDADALIHQATTIDQSPIDKDILYVGTSDGQLWVSKDETDSWTKIINDLPNGYVSSVKASPNKISNAFVTYSGYRDGDYAPKVYKSENYGASWKAISGNLPNIAINDVYIYPYREEDEVVFVAGDIGVFFTIDGGASWDRLGDNMPIVPVFDMDYNVAKNQIIAATFGRSIMTFDLDQVGINQELSSTSNPITIDWSIYPNPASQSINIKGMPVGTSYTIINIDGISLVKNRSASSIESISISNIPAGNYVIRSSIGNKSFVKK